MRRLWFVVLIVGLAACGSGAESPTETPPVAEGPPALEQTDDGNFTLYVSNQSFDRAQVDIVVFIDDRPAVDGDFAVENQHNWVEFTYGLADGPHAIRVESLDGDAVLEKRFDVAGKRWAVIDYWCCDSGQGEPKFTFHVSNEPIAFA